MEKLTQEQFGLYINGKWVPASDGATFQTRCPANGEVLATCAQATKEDVDTAVSAAWEAFKTWKDVTVNERAAILYKVADIIEQNAERCRALAERLPDVSVLCADGSRQDFLFSENISQMDAVVALTSLDEENVFICMYARMQGVPQAIPKVNRTEYGAVCQNCGIRSAVSPKDICAQEITRYVRAMESTDAESVLSVYSLLGGRVEALEFLVTADVPHLGESLASVRLQPGILLACISRGAKVLFPGGGDSLQTGDTVIVIAPRERHIAELRQIFDERG